jgi:signal transduction histidine kinase/ActR/RegA family two-component response regulator
MRAPLDAASPRPALPRIWLIAALAALALIAVTASSLWHLRREALAAQTRELSVLSLALAEALDRGLQSVELGLQATRLELRVGELLTAGDEPAYQRYPHNLKLPLASQLWIVDRRGRLLAASNPALAPDAATFAPNLATLRDGDVSLSRPFADIANGTPVVALAIRYSNHAGELGGWLIAALPVETLRGAFTLASPATDARMAVFRRDGVPLAGTLDRLSAAAMAASLLQTDVVQSAAARDPEPQVTAHRTLPRFGLHLVLTRDVAATLAPWRTVAWFATAALALLLAGLAAAAHRIARAEQRRTDAQAALQTQQARSNKLESLGTLAGGVAHDFNNVLAAVLGYTEMARQAAANDSRQARQLDHVVQAALRGKSLVARILAFSRSGARVDSVFVLQPLVDEVLAVLAASPQPNVAVAYQCHAPAAQLRGDTTQLFTALVNLCTNAMQAMPDGGNLVLSTARYTAAAAETTSHGPLAAGRYIAISISDEGHGIAADVMEHLFEPFFTTRRERVGTGLGLAVVHGVVAEFGGAINVESSAERGAQFTLYLPEAEGEPSKAAEQPSTPTGRGQTLLVVDDDRALVGLAEELLADLGYEAIGYTDPAAALAALRADPTRYDALLTDEVMPAMTGTQLSEAVRSITPNLPVMLISGYGGPQLAARAAAAGVTQVLAKPLQRDELAQSLARVLAHSNPPISGGG